MPTKNTSRQARAQKNQKKFASMGADDKRNYASDYASARGTSPCTGVRCMECGRVDDPDCVHH